jgi:hypothetical protein
MRNALNQRRNKVMGTYLVLELKDKSKKGIKEANKLWDALVEGNNGVVSFSTKEEIAKGERIGGVGTYSIKLTGGDYLCTRMARYYLKWIFAHGHLLTRLGEGDWVADLLLDAVMQDRQATDCLVENCPCRRKLQPMCSAGDESSGG